MQAELRQQKDKVLGWLKRLFDYSGTSARELNQGQGLLSEENGNNFYRFPFSSLDKLCPWFKSLAEVPD